MVSVEFDPDVNAMFIGFKKGKAVESEPLADNVVVGMETLLAKLAEGRRFVNGG